MITHASYSVEPWCLRETRLDFDILAQSESVFALSNGHIGWRANLDEGDPHGLPGSYLNGVYELRPLPHAEAGYGYPESGQTAINVCNGKVIRLLVDDEPFDVRYGELQRHERELDLRGGVLHRSVDWTSPVGRSVKVTTTRVVSLVQRAIAAIDYVVEATDHDVRIVLQSELLANEPLPPASSDPRASAVLEAPWVSQWHSCGGMHANLVHQTKRSSLMASCAMDHIVDGPPATSTSIESTPDLARLTVTTVLQPGERIRMTKFVAYGWSAERSQQALRDQVDAALALARQTGWSGLLGEQRRYLDAFWETADIEVDGDVEIQQAVRFAMFHVLQAGARAEGRAIPGKGLTGAGYDGHAFWDTETFVLPVLTYTMPLAAKHALTWRYNTLPMALDRAAQLDLEGSAFPWRTITGAECSAYWPAGTAAFHVSGDIAAAVVRYLEATSDRDFEVKIGLELLVETARLWRSLGHYDAKGGFRIDGVTGPDEYSAIADNNVYTNVMARKNLRAAADVSERNPERARQLGVDAEEVAAWRGAASAMIIPYDAVLGVHPQSEGFTEHQVWDFAGTPPDHYPLMLHYPYFDLYRKQVVKQADLILAMYLGDDAFTPEQKANNFSYYERITVRDSSLSACTQAVVAAEVGYLELAYDYLAEAVLIDLGDLYHNTRDGVHIASLAGAWIALIAGFAGMRERSESLYFSPRLPQHLARLSFGLLFRGRQLRLEITREATTYSLGEGEPLDVYHFGEPVHVAVERAVVCPTPPPAPRPVFAPVPSQPVGREPLHHRSSTPYEPEVTRGASA